MTDLLSISISQDDFNFDLLNSGDSASGASDLPAGDALTSSDAALWQQFMSDSPSVSGEAGRVA